MRTIDLKGRTLDLKTLEKFGFKKNDNEYQYIENILNGEFKVIITVRDEIVSTRIVEVAMGDEYLMADINGAVGEYVGKIRSQYEDVIDNFLATCTKREIYKSKQTKRIIEYVRDTYGDELEFLWKKFDGNAIWRNKNNEKWYGLIMVVQRQKLGLKSDEQVEILDLRYQKDSVEEIIDNETIFPGYHMSKKSWITIVLDESLPDESIIGFLDNSYNLSQEK